MPKQLPPIGSLRAFEAVGRLLSFTKAAEELHVTPGAISQQIRTFERLLNERMFERTRRSVSLTEAPLRYEVQCFRDWLFGSATKPLSQRQARGSA